MRRGEACGVRSSYVRTTTPKKGGGADQQQAGCTEWQTEFPFSFDDKHLLLLTLAPYITIGLRSSTARLPKGRAFFRKESARSAGR